MTKVTVTIGEKVPTVPEHYRIGTFFLDTKYNTVYMLAMVGPSQACMIGINDGNRFIEAVELTDKRCAYIGMKDFTKMVDTLDRFVMLENVEVKIS